MLSSFQRLRAAAAPVPCFSGGLLLVVAGFALPRGAAASCGDYVMVGGVHGEHHAAARPTSRDKEVPPAPSPCQRPFCKKRLPLPSAPERGASESTIPQWADCRAIVYFGARARNAPFIEAAISLPENHPQPLWRPPTQLRSA